MTPNKENVAPNLCLGWKTRAQLLVLHGGDEELVNRIVERKTASGETKEHPDLPDDPSATLYHVMLDLDQVEQDEFEDRLEESYGTDVVGDQAGQMADAARYSSMANVTMGAARGVALKAENEMPEDPVARGQWAMEKLMTDLQQVEKGGDFLVQLNAAVTLAMQRLQLYQEDAKEATTLTKPRNAGKGDLKWVKSQYHLFNYQTNNICSNCGVQKTHPNVAMTLANFEEDAGFWGPLDKGIYEHVLAERLREAHKQKPCRTLASATYVSLRVTTRSIWSRLRELAGTEEMVSPTDESPGRGATDTDGPPTWEPSVARLEAAWLFANSGRTTAYQSTSLKQIFRARLQQISLVTRTPPALHRHVVRDMLPEYQCIFSIRKRHSESLSVKPRDGSGYIEWEEFRQAAVQTDGRCTGRVGAAPAARGDAEPVTTTIRQVVCTMLKAAPLLERRSWSNFIIDPIDGGPAEIPDGKSAATTEVPYGESGYRKPAAKSSAKATAAKTMPQKKSPIPEFSSDPEELEEDLPMDDEWEEINPIGPQDIAMSSMENDVKEPTDISEARLARYWNEAAAWRMSRPEVGGFGPGREDGEDPKVQGRVKR
ncbi:unnamed protein product [Durusdinium trenchii]|uniref:EF-hand domain-containing protein n=1 Tax=Durusdinium trenchii TaxID=1381693 RepID=A0ABP0N4B2_9DINO